MSGINAIDRNVIVQIIVFFVISGREIGHVIDTKGTLFQFLAVRNLLTKLLTTYTWIVSFSAHVCREHSDIVKCVVCYESRVYSGG